MSKWLYRRCSSAILFWLERQFAGNEQHKNKESIDRESEIAARIKFFIQMPPNEEVMEVPQQELTTDEIVDYPIFIEPNNFAQNRSGQLKQENSK